MIPVRNVYYMLSYAFKVLNENGYKNMANERFNNVAELYAAILSKGVSVQLKKGIGREYISETEVLSSLRGKIDVSESIKTMSMYKGRMICTYDDFSVDSKMNQIIKATIKFLIHADISKNRKKELKKLLVFLDEVSDIDIYTINWNQQYNRNNQTYRMLISICYLVIKGLLQTNNEGNTKMMEFIDEQRMCKLYERFILEYYRKEHPKLKANASQIPWQLDDGIDDMLPVMQTDITLSKGNKVLIIDAKYYSKITQSHFNVHTIHSGNLYQIFTYVKNKELEFLDTDHQVSGMILYAKTDELIIPKSTYKMSGNKISVRTLNLDCEFSEIAQQLDNIAKEFFYDD
ncbi:5-methylcytosine-specific restriction endonuclease system specificity protein McrC [Caviibacter abscessus]|uniref:5-methylcytosine-specific restriction endonuclease system specificity protein McrC n=1 Tax=Caviibacter abscessus TaxID=1766719 RepID=UPI0008311E81|nr:5-methylcytosine-specific restriction endonuclease system specificity protein McrC [Caviibacter abscessus]